LLAIASTLILVAPVFREPASSVGFFLLDVFAVFEDVSGLLVDLAVLGLEADLVVDSFLDLDLLLGVFEDDFFSTVLVFFVSFDLDLPLDSLVFFFDSLDLLREASVFLFEDDDLDAGRFFVAVLVVLTLSYFSSSFLTFFTGFSADSTVVLLSSLSFFSSSIVSLSLFFSFSSS